MANGKSNNPGGFITKLKNLDSGTQKNIVGKSTVTVTSKAMTGAQISTQIENFESTYGAVASARTALKQALAAWIAVEPQARQFVVDYSHALKALFGARNPILADFGINPAKPKSSRTAAQKAVSAALAKQTRDLRGVKGKNQKAAITITGKPGLALVSPTGQILASSLPGPTPPGQSGAVAVPGAVASSPGESSTTGGPADVGSGASSAPAQAGPAAPAPVK